MEQSPQAVQYIIRALTAALQLLNRRGEMRQTSEEISRQLQSNIIQEAAGRTALHESSNLLQNLAY